MEAPVRSSQDILTAVAQNPWQGRSSVPFISFNLSNCDIEEGSSLNLSSDFFSRAFKCQILLGLGILWLSDQIFKGKW